MDAGMKVVCICADWSDWIPDAIFADSPTPNFPADPVVGRIYTIAKVSFDDMHKMCLNLKEIPDQQVDGGRHSFRYYASGFRPLEEVHNDMFQAMVHREILAAYRPVIELFDRGQSVGPSKTTTR